MKPRHWPLAQAQNAAQRILDRLAPYADRIEIAGSIRRRKAQVGDIEILAIPSSTPTTDLFGQTIRTNMLDAHVLNLIKAGVLAYRLTATGRRSFGSLNKLLTDTETGIGVDLFSTTWENWGMALMVRTGPAVWNVRMMTRFRTLSMYGHAYGGVTRPGLPGHESSRREEILCETEEKVFQLLGWPWTPPEERT